MRILLILAILLVSACGNQPIRPDKQDYQGLAQAQSNYRAHNYQMAASQYESLYNEYGDNEFILFAVDSYLQSGYPQKAQDLLNHYDGDVSHPLLVLIKAQLALNKGDYQVATYNLSIAKDEMSDEYYPRYLSLSANIAAHKADFLAATLDLVELSELRADLDLNNQIIAYLVQIPENQLSQALFDLDISTLQKGWLEAAYVASSRQPEAINQWKMNWPNHPAHALFLQNGHYDNVAVLLPLSGKYRNIAASIQQGMIASLYRDGSSDEVLHFFDTGSNGESFSAAWYEAIESGAQFVIGPLDKQSINSINQLNSATVPVLLLNKLPQAEQSDSINLNSNQSFNSNPNGFYQFALSQEDEVRNVADRLNAEHKKRVMLLAPDTPQARKLASQFEKDFAFNGGDLVTYGFYPKGSHDFSNEIKKSLGLYESRARIKHLQSLLATKLESEPQIRPDIDAIFVLAKAKQTRLIKPQLKFYKAERVPVYTTSQVYSPRASEADNKDLQGIRFPLSQFVIAPQTLADVLPFDASQVTSNKKFFAFGFDAIALFSRLEWMQKIQNQKIQGLSGQISMDLNGVVHRELAWAEFKNGKIVLLPKVSDAEKDDSQPESNALSVRDAE